MSFASWGGTRTARGLPHRVTTTRRLLSLTRLQSEEKSARASLRLNSTSLEGRSMSSLVGVAFLGFQ